MARREITTSTTQSVGTRREVAQTNPVMDLVNFLTYGMPSGIQKSSELVNKRGQQIQDKAKSGDILGAIGQTINPADIAQAASPTVAPAAGTAATYVGLPMLIKSLIPYLTYGGVNRFKETLANKNPNGFLGKDLQSSFVENLTSGNKLGNVKSDVETIVNDLLTRRMPGGYSNQNVYNAGDLNQLGQNIGKFEQGYDYGTPGNVVRTAVTDLVKNVAPETKFPYMASSFLNKIGNVPGVGGLLKNPITWPVAAWGSTKIPKVAKVLLGIQ